MLGCWSLAVSLEPLTHCFIYRCYFGRCSSELALWFHFLILLGVLLIILTENMIFLSPFLCVMECLYQQFLSSHTLWNSLPIECFPLTYYLDGFKGCVCYIFASLFFKSEQEDFISLQKLFLFSRKSNFSILDFQIS